MTEVKYDIGVGEIIAKYDEYGIMKITRECFEELIRKQIPQKTMNYKCPTCREEFCTELWEVDYCCRCGQRLKWSDEE